MDRIRNAFKMNRRVLGGLLLCIVSLISNSVGLAIPHWLYFSGNTPWVTVNLYYGLWQVCFRLAGNNETSCFPMIPSLPPAFNVVRSLEIVAVPMLAVAIILASIKVFAKKDNNILLQIAGIVAIFAGVLMIVGAVVFVTSEPIKLLCYVITEMFRAVGIEPTLNPHAGFALCIVSGVLSFAAGILFFFNKQHDVAEDVKP